MRIVTSYHIVPLSQAICIVSLFFVPELFLIEERDDVSQFRTVMLGVEAADNSSGVRNSGPGMAAPQAASEATAPPDPESPPARPSKRALREREGT
ncbi:hypothetical protein TGARI_235140A [Toxoplasma gondii ARI]|uniref:Transmembrane protein n=2 Tax=Toxoplasma gondii TaxID=5811 RepID=A0A139XUG0_TOXGO|nr:hypothetical protein TGARI_235140A [Toxoplasma gondii ARI]